MESLDFKDIVAGMVGEDYCGEEVTIIDKGLAQEYGETFVEELAQMDFDEDTECVNCMCSDGESAVFTYGNGGVDVYK